jgi:hypothetical protein
MGAARRVRQTAMAPNSLAVINFHNRHDVNATWRKKEKKPVPMKNKPGWFEDRR